MFLHLGRPRPSVFHELLVGFPRVETHCKYYKPARMGDLLEVTIWVAKRTQRTLQYCFEVRRDGEHDLVAEGNYTVVCINRQFKSVPIPHEVIELFGDFMPPMTERHS